jgi:hypothetical protein
MAKEIEELFVREVEVGVVNLDISTDEGTTSTRVVAQRITAHDRTTGQERELLLVYDPADVATVGETLRKASERAFAEQS